MNKTKPETLETDPRFPSGPWVGFFLQSTFPGRHMMDLHFTFSEGRLTGEGRDWVGPFTVRGRYNLADGKCSWTKHYTGQHDVLYKGYNEGKGIWGVWEFPFSVDDVAGRGGFHVWPKNTPEPDGTHLTEQAFASVLAEQSR